MFSFDTFALAVIAFVLLRETRTLRLASARQPSGSPLASAAPADDTQNMR